MGTSFNAAAHPRDPSAPNPGWFRRSTPIEPSPAVNLDADFDDIPCLYTGLEQRDQPRMRLRNGECWVDGEQYPEREFDSGVKVSQRSDNLLSGESASILVDGTVLHHDKDGYLHCADGPAVVRPNGTREYWDSGRRIDGMDKTGDPDRY